MTLLADLLSTVFERRYRFIAAGKADGRPLEKLTADLIGATGESAGLTAAREILGRYEGWDDDGKRAFFRHLAEDMRISPEALRDALAAYEEGQSKFSYRRLMQAAEPPRQELIRRLNQLPGATGSLVRMRADLLRLGRGDDALEALDLDFRHLFASWFNRGFLVLRPINWESPAHILEKIIAYEAVHAIETWDDLRRRLEPPDRRCFAFFHPAMPNEPLIFVEVALTRGVPGSVQGLLAEGRDALDATEADTAVFYSISNCQAGLASISFGNSLIKQVAADLSMALPGLRTFVTLSPIPGLTRWLDDVRPEAERTDGDLMKTLAAHYLYAVKREDGLPRDPVARFHLGNGALIHKLHADADLSDKGREQSAGVMVNYLYDLDRVLQNHERFASDHVVAASSEVRSLSAAAARKLN
ncbi:malonyl-CoA decarboxylase [Jannaschia aquimarina]|uniref:Malonyl-CoA decarboxylase (MCD) n=1 Tax=Jannaschia aquimarina TaxID=935700 RepID=A0A0D1EIY4_9RHOB|nr:malonyl-CoA decarboxylase [Jannaschia aquimarina]KIT17594.1 Malonyl-CoA decarboxylase (MCD) [Jannaschia aquimarina]SNS71899.1 malonyl-CoA decarboxylase [Jannaschia aquimarina]